MPLEKVGVDQSGTINNTQNHTGIVFCPLDSETPNYKIFVPKTVSSKINDHIKGKCRSKSHFVTKSYATTLYYLLKDASTDIGEIVMEEEYSGKMDDIINCTCNWLRDINGQDIKTEKFTIQPRQPHFKADTLANKVRKGEVNADQQLDLDDFRKLML